MEFYVNGAKITISGDAVIEGIFKKEKGDGILQEVILKAIEQVKAGYEKTIKYMEDAHNTRITHYAKNNRDVDKLLNFLDTKVRRGHKTARIEDIAKIFDFKLGEK